jgi:prepilin-type N-terminal cleavage/methylation domain-containing protein
MSRTLSIASGRRPKGFTLIELLIGSSIMLIVIVAALTMYSKSNQMSVDEQQYTEIQNDVRSAMYMIMRDTRMAGIGLPQQFLSYSLQAVDNEDQGVTVKPDRLTLIGNMENPLILQIQTYGGYTTSSQANLADDSFESYPYLDSFYPGQVVLILPNPAAACRAGEVRVVDHISHASGGTSEVIYFKAGMLSLNLPGNLLGTCGDATNYGGGQVMFLDFKEYWLDVTGSYPGLTKGTNGYLGVPNVLYVTKNGVYVPVAQNIENFQVLFNGDFDGTGQLNGFRSWNTAGNGSYQLWGLSDVANIRQVKVFLLGRTANAFVSVSGQPTGGIASYRRPHMANSTGSATDDMHRRFLLQSTSQIRNMSLNLYNGGQR